MTNQPPVVLLHGLYETTWYMKVLANRLHAQGFDVHLFRYYSLKDGMPRHSDRLSAFIQERQLTRVNLIGHSLGGLVIRHFLHHINRQATSIQVHRALTLATPHLGSVSAKYAQRLAPPLINNAFYDSLDGNCPPLNTSTELGVIAGNKPQGLGTLFLKHYAHTLKAQQKTPSDLSHDGTVYVFETRLPNAKDHLILPVSHTGILLSKEVAKQSVHFLTHGHFFR